MHKQTPSVSNATTQNGNHAKLNMTLGNGNPVERNSSPKSTIMYAPQSLTSHHLTPTMWCACVRACVRVCLRAYVVCVCVYVCMYVCMYACSDVIGLLLSTGSLRVYFLLLLTSFWQKREKLPPSAIFASFKWTFKQYIKISWYSTRVRRASFSQQWSPFARVRDSIVFHHLL